MPSRAYPDGIPRNVAANGAARHDEAHAHNQRWQPLNNHDNRQCGLLAAKA
jgi:hypothetical protein